MRWNVCYHDSATVASQCRLQQLGENWVSVGNVDDLLPHCHIGKSTGGGERRGEQVRGGERRGEEVRGGERRVRGEWEEVRGGERRWEEVRGGERRWEEVRGEREEVRGGERRGEEVRGGERRREEVQTTGKPNETKAQWNSQTTWWRFPGWWGSGWWLCPLSVCRPLTPTTSGARCRPGPPGWCWTAWWCSLWKRSDRAMTSTAVGGSLKITCGNTMMAETILESQHRWDT